MNEDAAQQWIAGTFGHAAYSRVAAFVDAVRSESANQNLVSRSSLDTVWHRHVVDSAQLLTLAAKPAGRWIDIGSGAGFPGMVVGLITQAPMLLIEPRRKRAEFLACFARGADVADIISVAATRAEAATSGPAATISARAVASVPEIFAMSRHLSDDRTQYLLPRGRSVAGELENARAGWHGTFHVKPSMTDPESGILVATNVRQR